MKKISFLRYVGTLMASGLFGASLTLGLLISSHPAEVNMPQQPAVNYDSISFLKNNIIVGSSPFSERDVSKVQDLSGPIIPELPQQDERLRVIGLLPPDVVILKKGGETVTAMVGEDTKFGHINSVFDSGAVIDGQYREFFTGSDS